MKTQYRPYPLSSEPDYRKRLADVLSQPQLYQLQGLPLQIASLLGGTSREDLLGLSEEVKSTVQHPDFDQTLLNMKKSATRTRMLLEVALSQAQHYLWNTTRVVGSTVSDRFLKDDILTEEGVAYMRAMEYPIDDLHMVSPTDRRKLREDIAKAVNVAYEMLQTQPPASSRRQKVRSKR